MDEGYDDDDDDGYSLGTTDGSLGLVLGKKDGPIDGVVDGFALGSNDRLDVG